MSWKVMITTGPGGRSHIVKTDFRSIKSRSCLRTPRLSLASEITHHLFVSGSGLYLTLVKIDKREEWLRKISIRVLSKYFQMIPPRISHRKCQLVWLFFCSKLALGLWTKIELCSFMTTLTRTFGLSCWLWRFVQHP